MASQCVIILDKPSYYPGDVVSGRVDCNFLQEEKIRGIRVKFKGLVKVLQQTGKHGDTYVNDSYFDVVSDLLESETTLPPGHYSYPFTFKLPFEIPPTISGYIYGGITYLVEAVVDRPLAVDYKDEKEFPVHSYINLNKMPQLRQPLEVKEAKKPYSLCNNTGSITFSIHLPLTGYVPSQMVTFSAKVINDSRVSVEGVRFKLAQRFEFYAGTQVHVQKTYRGQPYQIVNSSVSAGKEMSWNLELRLPDVLFVENLYYSKMIKAIMELKGEVILPFGNKNLKLAAPITMGSSPFHET